MPHAHAGGAARGRPRGRREPQAAARALRDQPAHGGRPARAACHIRVPSIQLMVAHGQLDDLRAPPVTRHIGLQPRSMGGSDGVQAIGTTRDLGEGRPLSLHSMLRGVARGWPLLAKYGCAPPWKVFLSSGASYSSTGGVRGSAAVGCCCARGTSSSFSCRPADVHCTGVLQKQRGSRIVY